MADWIDGNEDRPPPELVLYLNIQNWGDPWGDGWMKWPAGVLPRLRLARNVYNAWKAYTKAETRTEWLKKADPAAREIVGNVKALRYDVEPEPTRIERWAHWAGVEDDEVEDLNG